VQLSKDDQQLKGFNWQPDKRPVDRNAVTPLSLRPSQRRQYEAHPRATYKQTDFYFPGYMSNVYKQIAVRDSLKRLRERDRQIAEQQAAEKAKLDSIAFADSLAMAESLAKLDTLVKADSVQVIDSIAVQDTLSIPSDSLAVADTSVVKTLTPEEIKAARKAEKEKAKAEKKAKREAEKKRKQEAVEAKWAEKDKRDAEKAAAKEAKRLAKERKRKRKALEDAAKQAQREAELLEIYKQEFREKKRREESK
jgi:hypothetical protein